MKISKKTKHNLGVIFYKYSVIIIKYTPRFFGIRLFGFLGVVVYHLSKRDKNRTIDGLKKVYGNSKNLIEIKKLAKSVYYNLGISLFDSIHLPYLSENKFYSYIKNYDKKLFEDALLQKKGIIGLTGHLSAFELTSQIVVRSDIPTFTIGAQQFDKRVDSILDILRARNDVKYVNRDRAGRAILKNLKKNRVFGVLIDQDTTSDGVFAPFLDFSAFTPVTMIKIALKTDTPIIFAALHRDRKLNYTMKIEGPLSFEKSDNLDRDAVMIANKFNNFYSEEIKKYPEQWVWMHRRWKRKPSDFPEVLNYDNYKEDEKW